MTMARIKPIQTIRISSTAQLAIGVGAFVSAVAILVAISEQREGAHPAPHTGHRCVWRLVWARSLVRAHFVKDNDGTSPKVFKMQVELDPGEGVDLSKLVSLRQLTTRTHHAGEHAVEIVINGGDHPAGSFVLAG
jgi:hypothetical protein